MDVEVVVVVSVWVVMVVVVVVTLEMEVEVTVDVTSGGTSVVVVGMVTVLWVLYANLATLVVTGLSDLDTVLVWVLGMTVVPA